MVASEPSSVIRLFYLRLWTWVFIKPFKQGVTKVQKLFMAIGLVLVAAVVCPAQVTFTEYPLPGPSGGPSSIIVGPDGNLWFDEQANPNNFGNRGDRVGRITPSGVITEFLVAISPTGITAGPDGNLWIADYFDQTIGKLTTAGVFTRFSAGGYPFGIASGPDGNLWFTERYGGNIGRVTTAGAITEFPVPSSGELFGITAGPDGNLWFTEAGTGGPDKIGRITLAGVVTQFPLASGSAPYLITSGPDGNLWFTDGGANKIGRITTAGVITEFPIPTTGSNPSNISQGPDGNLWFTENAGNNIARITPSGVITEFPVPSGSYPDGITADPDGNLWFTESGANKIVKLNVNSPHYNVCLLYDPTKAVKSGSTIPIKLQLCDATGNDLSSSGITLHAVSVTQVSSSISGDVQDSGNANPDNDFRFDSSLGSTGGYIFNLFTRGLTTGTYNLNFTVTGDTFVYAAPFQVK